jgi:hypothetical protein
MKKMLKSYGYYGSGSTTLAINIIPDNDWIGKKTIPTLLFTLLIRLVRDRLLGPILSEKHNKGYIQITGNFRMSRNH